MFKKITEIFKAKDLRYKILFVLGIFAIFRLMANIPIPGIDVARNSAILCWKPILRNDESIYRRCIGQSFNCHAWAWTIHHGCHRLPAFNNDFSSD